MTPLDQSPNAMPTVSVASKEQPKDQPFKVMPQTKVAFIGYLLILISMVIFLIQNPKMIPTFVPAIIAYIVMYLFALYVINCTVTGNCNLVAWIIAYVIAIVAILTILGLVVMLWKN